jgi:hypothetical protein
LEGEEANEIMVDRPTKLTKQSVSHFLVFLKCGTMGGTWPHYLHISHHSYYPYGNGLGTPFSHNLEGHETYLGDAP